MAWVLIIMLWGGVGATTSPAVATQEFGSEAMCKAAAEAVSAAWGNKVIVLCTPK